MLPRPSTNICPKDLTRDMRGFFNSLLGNLGTANEFLCMAEHFGIFRSLLQPYEEQN